MTENRSDWETLSAYVDGELEPQQAAEVARQIALRPDWASAVAALQDMKAQVIELGAAEADDAPAMKPVFSARIKKGALAAVVAVSALVIIATLAGRPTSTQSPVELARAHHTAWLAEAPRLNAGQNDLVQPAALDLRIIPDLAEFGLAPVTAGPVELGLPTAGQAIGYEGRRGCRLSLIILPPGANGAVPLGQDPNSPLKVKRLQTGGADALIVASGMDPRRFALIADSLQQQLQQMMHPSDAERMALRDAPDARRPCLA